MKSLLRSLIASHVAGLAGSLRRLNNAPSKPFLNPNARWLLAALCLTVMSARAEYSYFSDVPSDADIVVKEVRWPYWNSYYYNTWWSDNWASSDGVSGYFYNGLALPPAGSPNPVTAKRVINWSFWPLSNPINVDDTITPDYTYANTFAMPTIGEGTILRSPGMWSGWQTNVWYRMVIRTWRPVDGTPHRGYAGTWMRDAVSGVWYHQASIQLPFAVTGAGGSMGFQENASGGTQPQRTDYRGSYYHKNGAWNSSTNFYIYVHGSDATENVGLIEGNTAVYYETCKTNGVYVGTYTNGQTSPTFKLTQPAVPTFDPIVVTNYGATVSGSQLLVQWQLPATSSPQFAYKVEVYTNASYTGSIVASAYDIAPETRQKLLAFPNGMTPYARLTIIDLFDKTNAPINLTPTSATLLAATNVPGAVGGLNYAYYHSATSYTTDANTNWATMPNFASLTPVASGAVSGVDLTPRQRRYGYAFNYTGFVSVPTNGLYAFTLNSCDGSKLYVDGQLVINGDGKHSPTDASSWIGLQAGQHALNVQYFCDVQPTSLFSENFDTLSLSYEGPGISKTAVPVTAFSRVPGGSEPVITLSSPTNGATISGASVPLTATVTPNGNTINKVQFYVDDYYWAQDASSPYSVNSFLWAYANNPLRARLFYNTTNVIESAVNTVTTTNMTLAPWDFRQIFYHNQPNGAKIVSGTYSMIGDGVNLLTRQVSGDCTLIAHLAGITSTATAPDGSSANTGWQAGIILRGTTAMTPGYPWGTASAAPFAAVFGQVNGGTYYQDQTMVNGGGGYSSGNLGGQKWLKLQRTGNTFTSSVSSDGTTWTQVNSTNLTGFGTTLYAGFFSYAGPSSNPNIHWASFDSVSLTGNILGPPSVSVNPQTDTVYAGQNAMLTATPSGASPFAYQWQFNNVAIAGATNATLPLTNLQPPASGLYTVQVSNSNGVSSATATLTVLTPPAPVATILSNTPIGYWRLNETAGPTAYDSAGNNNGTGEGGIVFGVPGVTNSPFTGFETDNLGAQFNGTDADVSLPAFNVTTTNFTITGWVKRNGSQNDWSGIVFSRNSGNRGAGVMVVGNALRYSWNDNGSDYNWSTGLTLPDGQWTFFALTVEPTRAIIYMATNSALQSRTNAVANTALTTSGGFWLGTDGTGSGRRFNGTLDEIAMYNRTLTFAQVSQVFAASQSNRPPAISLDSPASGAAFAEPALISLAASVATNGHAISSLQFYNGTNLLGQTTTAPFTCTWSNVPAGAYTLFAQVSYDSGNTASSVPAFITVNPVPSASASITPSALSGNLISIRWPVANYATGYILSRDGSPVAWLTDTNYLDFGLSPGTTYAYSVVATNSYGVSPSSVTNSATTPGSGTARWWDAAGATAGAQDGSGNWGNSANTWWDGSANVTWANNSLALFGSGTTTNCAVALTNAISASGILFNANNGGSYSLSGSTLTLSSSAGITAYADATVGTVIAGSQGLVKNGAGTLTLGAINTFTGGFTVNGGLVLLKAGAYNLVISTANTTTINNGGTVEAIDVNSVSGNDFVVNTGGSLKFSANHAHPRNLTLAGGLVTGSGSGKYNGDDFQLDGTTLTVNGTAPSTINLPNGMSLRNAPAFNVADVTGNPAPDLIVTGPAPIHNYDSGPSAFTKTGAGTMQLSGNNTYTGTTTINGGTLQVDGTTGTNTVTVGNTATLAGTGNVNGAATVQSGGILAPGDTGVGRLTLTKTLTLNSGSKTVLEISRAGSILTNDLVAVTGALSLNGTLIVTNIGPDALALGDSFDLFNAGGFSGDFSAKTLPALAANLVWDTSGLTNNGIITVVSIPVITNQPQSLTVNQGLPASFAVGATGSGVLAYQWQKNGANIGGAVTSSYSIASATTTDAGNYAVIITNNYGSVTSAVAVLAVNAGPTISAQPQSVSAYVNSNATFSVTASGTPTPTYQWRFNGANLPGATATSYVVTAAQTTNEGAYTVVVSNAGGSITSSVANLTLHREFGRAPAPYPSLLANDGARHLVVPGFQLGATNVISTDARTNGLGDDGVQFITVLQPGQLATVQVVASAAGWLNGWIDYSANNSWTNAGEQTFANVALVAGTNTLNFTVPTTAATTTSTWARFRFSSETNLTMTGQSVDGEVEDYPVAIAGFTLAYTAGPNGSLTGTTPQTVNYGANGTAVTATANTGYHFVNWSDGSTSNPRTDSNVTNNLGVTANFAINTYTLTYTAGANGSISGTTPQTVNYGASGSAISATADTGYHFVNWSDGGTANPRTDANVTNDISVTANFAINTYILTYNAGANGSISGSTPQTVNHGASGTAVTAVPNSGYAFTNWSDGLTLNPRTDVNVTNNITVTANFVANGPGALPAPWTTNKIGTITANVAATYSSGTFNVTGGGANISGKNDNLWFVNQPWSGDATLTARVSTEQNTGSATKAGVMFRESTATGSRSVFMGLTPTSGAQWVRRSTTGGNSSTTTAAGIAAPYWVRLTRNGNTFTGYTSPNGASWTQVASASISMATNCSMGLAVSSGSSSTTNLSVFDSVSVTNIVMAGAPLIATLPPTIGPLALGDGTVSFSIAGETNSTWLLQESTDGVTWSPLQTITVNGGAIQHSEADDQRAVRLFRLQSSP